VAGNGGSAADAQHIAAELVGRFQKNRRAVSAFSLSTDTSCLTAIGNDFGFDQIFSRQIEAHVSPNDVVWLLSVSGTSPNIVNAFHTARQKGAKIILFTGEKGSELCSIADAKILVLDTRSDVVQNMHQIAYHYICGCIEEGLIAPQ
jgi:D-sedoheptulose 7-phosphate isomerase